MPRKHLFPRDKFVYIFGVVIDWNDSKVATGLCDSSIFINAPFSCLSKKLASYNPNEGGDFELHESRVQTK